MNATEGITLTLPDGTTVELPRPREPRHICCDADVCPRCGGHNPLDGPAPICRCGTQW